MAAYNAAPYIGEAVESVLRQNYSSYEFLIMDDGSTDTTGKILDQYRNDPHVRIFRRRHRGIATTRNELIHLSGGEFISMHDADDIMLQGKLAIQAQYLISNKQVGVVYGNCLILDQRKKHTLKRFQMNEDTENGRAFVPRIPNCSSMIRKACFSKVGYYNSEYLIADDTEMWTRLSEVTKFKYLKKYFYIYRIHKNSITQRMFPALEQEDETLTQSAIYRRSGRAMKRFKLLIHEAQLSVRTNSAHIYQSIQKLLYLSNPSQKPKFQFDFELHEVPSIQGIYPQIKFSEKGDFQIGSSKNENTFFWKSDRNQFLAKISREEKKSIFYVVNVRSLPIDLFIEYALLYPLIFLMRPHGWHFVHSACITGRHGAAMIAGPTMSGKTTLSMMLINRNCKLMSDETNIVFFQNKDIRVKGFPIKPKIKKMNLPQFPELIKNRGHLLSLDGQKFFFAASLLRKNAQTISSAALKLIVYPQYQSKGKLKIHRISHASLLKLLRDTNHYSRIKMSPKEILDYILLSKLLYKNVPIYQCQYSKESIKGLMLFVEEHLEKSGN